MKRTIVLLSCLTACAIDDETVDESREEQAVSGTMLQSHTCGPYQDTCTIALPNNGCVIAGITGGLGGTGGLVKAEIEPGPKLVIEHDPSNPITVKTVCVSGVTTGPTVTWTSGAAPKQITGGANAGRRCMLSGIRSNHGAFTSFGTNVAVVRSGDDHVIDGHVPYGVVGVDVRCFDVTQVGAWSYGNGAVTTVSGELAKNPRAGGVACALTGIGGQIDFANRGVAIEYSSSQWSWWMTGLTGGNALCFQ